MYLLLLCPWVGRPSAYCALPRASACTWVRSIYSSWFLSRRHFRLKCWPTHEVSDIGDTFVLHTKCSDHFNKVEHTLMRTGRERFVHAQQTHSNTPNERKRIERRRRNEKKMSKAFKNDLKFNYSGFRIAAAAGMCATNLECHTRTSPACVVPSIRWISLRIAHTRTMASYQCVGNGCPAVVCCFQLEPFYFYASDSCRTKSFFIFIFYSI